MQYGRGGSGIAASPVEPVPVAKGLKSFLRACGKFCAEVASQANKCLFLKRFFGIEPTCSNRVKPVAMNDLAWFGKNSKGFYKGWLFGAEFGTISTVRTVGVEAR